MPVQFSLCPPSRFSVAVDGPEREVAKPEYQWKVHGAWNWRMDRFCFVESFLRPCQERKDGALVRVAPAEIKATPGHKLLRAYRIVRLTAADAPPPGAGLITLTLAVPAAAMSDAGISTCNVAPST